MEQQRLSIFISCSKDRGRCVAKVLRDWLLTDFCGCTITNTTETIGNSLDIWAAQEDIEPGQHWVSELHNRLTSENTLGLLIVTPETRLSHWLHFEMGVLLQKRSHGAKSTIFPLLFEMEEKNAFDPIKQYQGRTISKKTMRELLENINERIGSPMTPQQLEELLDRTWPNLEKEFKGIARMVAHIEGLNIADTIHLSDRRREEDKSNIYLQDAEDARIVAMTYKSLGRNMRRKQLKFQRLTRLELCVYALPNLKINHPLLYNKPDILPRQWKRGLRQTIEGFMNEELCPCLRDFSVVVMSVAPTLTGTNVSWRNRDNERGEFLRITFVVCGSEVDEQQTMSILQKDDRSTNEVYEAFGTLFNNVGKGTPAPLHFQMITDGVRRPDNIGELVKTLADVSNHPKAGIKDRAFTAHICVCDNVSLETTNDVYNHFKAELKKNRLRASCDYDNSTLLLFAEGNGNLEAQAFPKPHILACFILMTHNDEVLLINNKKGIWDYDLPGGKAATVDNSEVDTLRREIFEEIAFLTDKARAMEFLGLVYDPHSQHEPGMPPVVAKYYHYPLTDDERCVIDNVIVQTTKQHTIEWLLVEEIIEHKDAVSSHEVLCHAPLCAFRKLVDILVDASAT